MLPVIGVPLPTSDLKGMDSLLAMVQMPGGVPVAVVAIGSAGAKNAALLAAQMLGIKHAEVKEAYAAYRKNWHRLVSMQGMVDGGIGEMIEGHSRPAMKKVWSDESKFDKWLKVVGSVEAWAELGTVSKADLARLRNAEFNPKRYEEILKVTHHDMTAFVNTVAESLGPESRFIHLGLTSSDIMDTALSLQLLEASDILGHDIADLPPSCGREPSNISTPS
jgi:hypothetical protein